MGMVIITKRINARMQSRLDVSTYLSKSENKQYIISVSLKQRNHLCTVL